MALTPVLWVARLVERLATAAVQGECLRLRLELDEARNTILTLERDLEAKQYRQEARDIQVEALQQAHAVNMTLLDKMVVTHGFNSPKT